MSSFHYLTMYLNSFVPKTKRNCGCISQVCIYIGIFRFWNALCDLLGDKCSIASSCLVHKTRSAFLLHGKTGKNFRVKGTVKFSSVKMERDERVPFTPIYVKKTLNPPNSNIN